MNVIKYGPYFHDGSLIDIEQVDQEYLLSMESAEMDLEAIEDDVVLSERKTIKGKLHLEKIQSIWINDLLFHGELKMLYDYGTIFDLNFQQNRVELQISWRNAPGKPEVNDFSTVVVQADKIWWENIPDLLDPFW